MTNSDMGTVLGHERIQQAPKQAEWFPVDLDLVPMDSMLPFDLYLPRKNGQPPVLYRSKGTLFTEEIRNRIIAMNGIELLIKSDASAVYQDHLERNLGKILGNSAIPMVVRSGILYTSAKRVMRQIIENPQMDAFVERSGKIVEHMVHFLFQQSSAFAHLIKMTSFDYYTYTHCVNVFIFGTSLAQKLGYPEEDVFAFGQGALLHDIGKSMVPGEILNFKGKLSAEQFEEIKKHPVYGHDWLVENGVKSEIVLDVVRHHHEKLNGVGYPDKLSGTDLSPFARISTIADIFDALTTRRVYKDALGSFPSLKLMKEEMEQELDPQLFREFVGLMSSRNC